MTDKASTIQEIRASYDQQSAGRLSEWYRRVEEIASEREPEGGELLDYLNPQQRGEVLLDQMSKKVDEERAARIEEAMSAFDAFQDKHEMRAAWLDLRLFHVEDAGQMVASAVMASDEQLAQLLEAAKRTNSLDLARVVFGEAERRGGLPEIIEGYFEMDLEARDLLEESRQAFSPEDLERKRGTIEALFSRRDLPFLARARGAS
jgi:hypothetical protein